MIPSSPLKYGFRLFNKYKESGINLSRHPTKVSCGTTKRKESESNSVFGSHYSNIDFLLFQLQKNSPPLFELGGEEGVFLYG